MIQPPQPANSSFSLFGVIGLLLGVVALGLVIWDVSGGYFNKDGSSSNAKVIELTRANWQKEVVESKVPVVVDFWAPWCGPCLQFAKTIDKLADKYEGKVKFGKVNTDKEPELAATFQVDGIPHVFILKQGEVVANPGAGKLPEATVGQLIDRVLNNQ